MSLTGTILREAKACDSPTLNALVLRVVKASNYDRKTVALFTQKNKINITPAHMAHFPFWVAERDEQIIGCISLDPNDGKTGQVRNLYVTPKLKGKGIGRLLWFRLALIAQTQGFRELSVSSDPASVSFYEMLGFRTQRITPVPGLESCACAYMTFRL